MPSRSYERHLRTLLEDADELRRLIRNYALAGKDGNGAWAPSTVPSSSLVFPPGRPIWKNLLLNPLTRFVLRRAR